MNDTTWMRWMHWGSSVCHCHQMPERSFFYRGYQFPVCARCTGVFLGYFLFAISAWLFFPPLWLILSCMGVMLLDWLIQFFKIKESTNLRRLISGTIGGYGVLALFVTVIKWVIAVAG